MGKAMMRRIAASVFGGAAALAGSAAMAADAGCLGLAPDRIGMQLYSTLSELRPPQPAPPPGAPRPPPAPLDPARLDSVFARLQTIGWRNVENFGGNGGLGDAAYKAAADRHGIRFVAGHENLDDAGFAAALARAKAFGQTYVGSGNYGQPGLETLENVLATAEHLNRLGQQAAAQGLKFYVHNHQVEFKNTFSYDLNGDGRPETVTAWDIVTAKTDPRYVNFEIDVHWARLAMGLDKYDELLAFLQKHRSRVVLLHVKDTAPDGKIADLGRGTTDWRRLMAAAGPQVGYYLWEFDGPPNPMESAAIAYNYMTCGRR
jgi:sugar phosphate isomerase/epimerase